MVYIHGRPRQQPPVYADLASLAEDERITAIGTATMAKSSEPGRVVGFVVETDEKADRYVTKLQAKFPTIRVLGRQRGPTHGTILVRVAPPLGTDVH